MSPPAHSATLEKRAARAPSPAAVPKAVPAASPRAWWGLVVPVAVLVLLEAASRAGWVASHLLPPPSEVLNTVWWLLQQGNLPAHVAASSLRVLAGFVLGAGLALGVGALVGL